MVRGIVCGTMVIMPSDSTNYISYRLITDTIDKIRENSSCTVFGFSAFAHWIK